MTFLDCPAYLDSGGAVRCGLPAEVSDRFTMRSTEGPLESATIRCPAGHCFIGPIEFLTWDGAGHDGRHGGGGSAQGDFPARSERNGRRPNTAPAYYLGHPVALWISVMRPRRRRTESRYLMATSASSSNSARDFGAPPRGRRADPK